MKLSKSVVARQKKWPLAAFVDFCNVTYHLLKVHHRKKIKSSRKNSLNCIGIYEEVKNLAKSPKKEDVL